MSHSNILETAAALRRAGEDFALVTVVRVEAPTSAKPGAKALVTAAGAIHGWIGGGCTQPAVIKSAKKAIADGAPRLIRISPGHEVAARAGIEEFAMSCHSGGTLEIFVDPLTARPAVAILGASAAARALCALAAGIGYDIDAAAPAAGAELFPEARSVADGFVLPTPCPTFVVIATQGKGDEEALEAALAAKAPNIWFIASRRKADKLRAYLRERGVEAARADAIVAPAGIDIGAAAPEEIALSVLAGLVRARHSNRVSATAEPPAEAQPAPAIDPICGMSVAIAGARYHSEYEGRDYYFCGVRCKNAFDKAPQDHLAASHPAD